MPSTALLVLALAPVLLFTIWHISSTISPPPIPSSLRNKRIVLLIAHPDDESMFFSPALQALTEPSLDNHVKILCLSTGDADGLGETRRTELESAGLMLGLRGPQDVFVMDDERFKDGMKEDWSHGEIARVLAQAFAPHLIADGTSDKSSKSKSTSSSKSSSSSATSKFRPSNTQSSSSNSNAVTTATSNSKKSSKDDAPTSTIDVLLTFDPHGVSSHPNHISLHHGSTLFLTQLMKGRAGHRCPIDLYTLTSINVLRKYSSVFDLMPTYIHSLFSSIFDFRRSSRSQRNRSRDEKRGDRAVFVSSIGRYWRGRRAMVRGHKSQMVWFRWGWITMGRYMVINDLRRELVVAS